MYKIIHIEEKFPVTGEPTIQLIDDRFFSNVKTACESVDYLKTISIQANKTYVLILAVSGEAHWGCNSNFDSFPSKVDPRLGIEEKDLLQNNYKSFERGGIFKHHQNRDPSKSMGKILKAFYNVPMDRVELAVELCNDLADSIIERIKNGEYPRTSMGTRIKHDICSICGHRAPTRAEYCDHAKFELGRYYPDGRRVYVANPSPDFFDISFVVRGADKASSVFFKKVANAAEQLSSSAELGEKVAEVEEKKAVLKKLSDMDKLIKGQIVDHEPKNKAIQIFCQFTLPNVLQNSPEFDQSTLSELSQHSLPTALSTLTSMGISPTSPEIAQMMTSRAMPGMQMPQGVLDRIGASSGSALQLLEQHPEIMQAIEQSGLLGLSPQNVNKDLQTKVSSWIEKRSNFKNYLLRRSAPFLGEAHPDIGNWENVDIKGPSGETYQTTAGAIDRADDVNIQRKLKTLAGAALLSGAAYKALSAHPQGKYIAPLMAAAGAIGTGAAGRLIDVPSAPTLGNRTGNKLVPSNYTLDEAPINSEMQMKHGMDANTLSVIAPLASSAAATAMLAQEYNRRAREGQLGQSHNFPNKAVEGLGEIASHHPVASFISLVAGTGLGANLLSGAEKFIKRAELDDEDGVKLAKVDLDGLCYWIGDLLFN